VREAVASGDVRMSAAARQAIRRKAVKKGDPLQTARLAGILAAKQTSTLVPLCHSLPLTHVDVELTPLSTGYRIVSRVGTVGRTGVEMEALVAVSVAALTLYDMLKAVDKTMVIGKICVLEKRGGRSGEYKRNKKSR
jgi:cyclic pyranopterin phosphate synthase